MQTKVGFRYAWAQISLSSYHLLICQLVLGSFLIDCLCNDEISQFLALEKTWPHVVTLSLSDNKSHPSTEAQCRQRNVQKRDAEIT